MALLNCDCTFRLSEVARKSATAFFIEEKMNTLPILIAFYNGIW